MSVERLFYSCSTAICQVSNGDYSENCNHIILLFLFCSDTVNRIDIRMCRGLACMQRATPVGLNGANAGCDLVA